MSTPAQAPPHNLQAEEALLGAAMLSGVLFDRLAFVERLEPRHFYRGRHAVVWQAMLDLTRQGEAIDAVTLTSELTRTNKLEQAGGAIGVDNLAGAVPSVANFASYVRIVRDLATIRDVLTATYEIQAAVSEPGVTGETLVADFQERAFSLGTVASQDRAVALDVAVGRELERLEEAAKSDRDIPGLTTGFDELDRMLGGFQPGNLIILAARPAMGKTAMAMNWAEHIAFSERAPVLFASLEMSETEVVQRHLSAHARISTQRLRSADLDDRDWQALMRAAQHTDGVPYTLLDEGSLTVTQLHAKARALSAKTPLGVIVVDYLQLMQPERSNGNRTEDVSAMSRGLKIMARDLNVPVVALSQLSRKVEDRADRRPQLADLRESGQIEADADAVLMLYRDDYYEPDSERPGETDVLVRKNRHGPTGEFILGFDPGRVRFRPHDG